ncbi:MAG: AgmX/PglI C-terminal domain-containing protein, partial [Myxococcota bacterium]|nr:AgmX/PglI C-terminal domain-containing protein [Myxococcota bacterium]
IICNGEAVMKATPLHSGSIIEIGTYSLQVTIADLGFAVEESTQVDELNKPNLQQAPPIPAMAGAGALGAAMNEIYDDEVDPFEGVEEDVYQFVNRANTADVQTGTDASKPKVLQVFQIYDRAVLGHKTFTKGTPRISIGSSSRFRMRFAGKPVAWIPKSFARFSWMMYPFTISKEEYLVDFHGPDIGTSNDFPLFESSADGFVCNIATDWQGFVDNGSENIAFGKLLENGDLKQGPHGLQFVLNEDSRIMIETGGPTYYAHIVPAPKQVAAGTGFNISYPFLALLFLMSAFFGGSIFLLSSGIIVPENDVNQMEERFAQMLLEEPPEPEEELPDANEDAGEGAKAKDDEGKVGKEDAVMKEAKGDKIEIDKKQRDKEIVDAAFGEMFGAAADEGSLEGMGAAALDASLEGGVGGLLGAKGVQMGAGGLGSRGSGLGGGGTANGLGGMGNKGSGRGSSGYGSGAGSYGKKSSRGLSKIGGQPIIMGALDKSLIDAVIKRNMNQIRYCYQRELTKNPSLGGKIVVKFTIAKDGSVSKANIKSSSMGNKKVESCIAGRFMQFKFPEPKGGGIVIVSYPFIFAPG